MKEVFAAIIFTIGLCGCYCLTTQQNDGEDGVSADAPYTPWWALED